MPGRIVALGDLVQGRRDCENLGAALAGISRQGGRHAQQCADGLRAGWFSRGTSGAARLPIGSQAEPLARCVERFQRRRPGVLVTPCTRVELAISAKVKAPMVSICSVGRPWVMA